MSAGLVVVLALVIGFIFLTVVCVAGVLLFKRRSRPSMDVWSEVAVEALVTSSLTPPPTDDSPSESPHEPPQRRLERLRSFFSGITEPGEEDWCELCAMFDGWRLIKGLDVELDYAQGHLASWPDELRRGPLFWVLGTHQNDRDNLPWSLEGESWAYLPATFSEPPPAWALARTLDLTELTPFDRSLMEGSPTDTVHLVCLGNGHFMGLFAWRLHAVHLTRLIVSGGRWKTAVSQIFGDLPDLEVIEVPPPPSLVEELGFDWSGEVHQSLTTTD